MQKVSRDEHWDLSSSIKQASTRPLRPLGKQLRPPLLLIWHQPWVLTSHVLVVVVQGQYIVTSMYNY